MGYLCKTIRWKFLYGPYGSTGCGVFKRGVQNKKDFCLRINKLKGNDWILKIGLMGRCQKLSVIFESILRLILSKNFNKEKCAPKLIFFNEKKLRKIWIIFDTENGLWKSNFGTFWHFLTPPH